MNYIEKVLTTGEVPGEGDAGVFDQILSSLEKDYPGIGAAHRAATTAAERIEVLRSFKKGKQERTQGRDASIDPENRREIERWDRALSLHCGIGKPTGGGGAL